MIVLDTNVFSVLMQPGSAPVVMRWLARQAAMSIWTTTITLFEVRYGLSAMPAGRKRRELEHAFTLLLDVGIERRVLEFDTSAALASGEIAAKLRRVGKPIDVRDVQIAGIIRARRASLATRNVRHFDTTGIDLVDPWHAT